MSRIYRAHENRSQRSMYEYLASKPHIEGCSKYPPSNVLSFNGILFDFPASYNILGKGCSYLYSHIKVRLSLDPTTKISHISGTDVCTTATGKKIIFF